jgi:hypothetical protein
MGRNRTRRENGAAILTAIARARARLISAERLIDKLGVTQAAGARREKLTPGRNASLHAQISDSLGWSAGATAQIRALPDHEVARKGLDAGRKTCKR